MKKLYKLFLALYAFVLLGCGNGFNNAGESCISFTLPQVYSGEGSARAVQLDESAYYVVKCVNSKTQKVVFFSEDVIPGNVINIENVLAGSYTIDIQLYQKDKWSGFENTIIQTSAKNTTCEVTAGETTNLEIKMPAPYFEGIMYTSEFLPFCASNEFLLAYYGEGIYIFIDSAENLPEKVKVTVECDGDSESLLCETDDRTVELSVEDSLVLAAAVENKKTFTCKVFYNEEQDKSYSVKTSTFIYDFYEDFENMKEFFSEDVCMFCANAFFQVTLSEYSQLLITKTKYPRIYMKYSDNKSETFDAKSYYFDSFNFEGNSVQFNEKLSFTSYEEESIESYFGKTFQTFDDLKAALGETFSKDVKINLVSSTDSNRNTSVTLPAKYASCVNQWLNGKNVVFPEPESEPDDPYDPPAPTEGDVTIDIDTSDLIPRVNVSYMSVDETRVINTQQVYRGGQFKPDVNKFEQKSDYTVYEYVLNGVEYNISESIIVEEDIKIIPKWCPTGYTVINNKDEFISNIRKSSVNGNYFLDTDIEITDSDWHGVAVSFDGIFNGNGHTITFNTDSYNVYPLFNKFSGIVMALKLKGTMNFSSSIRTCAPFGTVSKALIIACDLSQLSLTSESSDLQYYHFGIINDSSTVIASFYNGEEYENETGYDEDGGCFKNCYNTHTDESITAANNAIVTQNNNNPEYSCNYHFAMQDDEIVILSGAPN